MQNYKEILSNERLEDGNEWSKTSIKQHNIIGVDKCTITRLTEAIVCSMVFDVKQFRMTWWSGRNINFKHFNDYSGTRSDH